MYHTTQRQRLLRLTMVACLMMSMCSSLFSQVIDSRQYNYVGNWYRWQGGTFINNLNIPKIEATTGRDTGAIRYRLADSSLYVWTGSQWRQVTGGGGGSTSLNNVGTGFDLAQQGTANVKRLAGGFGIKLDSTTTANTVRVSLDTTTQTLTDAATVTFDANLGVSAKVTLTATRTLAFTNFRNGMFLSLAVIQNGTGGWGLNLPAGTKVINGGAGAVTLTTAANSHDILTFWKAGDVIYCNYGKNYN